MTTTNSQFVSTHNHGFQMTFDNGITISVQFGVSNYCERRSFDISYRGDMDAATPIISSSTAEIAIWHKDSDTWFQFESDQVKGWVTTNEVAEWISYIKYARDLAHLRNMAIINGLLVEDEGPEVDSAGFTEEDR
jgi:hypothetical protein